MVDADADWMKTKEKPRAGGRLADLHSDGGREDRHVHASTTVLLVLTLNSHVEGEREAGYQCRQACRC